MSWTSEKVEKLKELWSKGHTASQIAEKLGDTTRNAVIGKAHRLNLEARAPSKHSSSSKTKDHKQIIKRSTAPLTRKAKFQSILLDKTLKGDYWLSPHHQELKSHQNRLMTQLLT